MQDFDVIVIGAGHNGLVCACYLARAGLRVLVLEQADHIGGAVHTAETIPTAPGHRFDTCSVVHNLINVSAIPTELQLAELGLRYVETDPFSIQFLPDGSTVRFYRSVARTCDEIARFAPRDAEAYARFISLADPLLELGLAAFRLGNDDVRLWNELARDLRAAGQVLSRAAPLRLLRWLLGPYGALLNEWFATEHARTGLLTLAAHGTLGPQMPGAAYFAFVQALYHRYGNWHAIGGSGSLATALAQRLADWGGTIRTGAQVTRILADSRVRGVALQNGEQIATQQVVAAINPQTALLGLVDQAQLPRTLVDRLRARHRTNTVQFIVHAALSDLPPWPDAPPDVWNGLQSVAASVAQVGQNFVEAEAGIAPTQPAPYMYTSSAIDPSVAPPGRHSAYIACASYPARFNDGSSWAERGAREAERQLEAIEARCPGFRERVIGLAWRHAADWQRETGLLGGHPMHLDITLDQIGPLRPLPELARYRTPLRGLYLSGAGTPPAGGVAGVPGRATARALLRDRN